MSKRFFIFDLITYFTRDVSLGRILALVFILTFLPWLALISLPDNKLHIYYFDVGQGDSIFIKTPQNYQILIDGGPGNKVLYELGKVMPFYDRTLDLLILTHPHADHVIGLIEVLKRYQVEQVLVNSIAYDSAEYQTFLNLTEELKIKKNSFLAGDQIKLKDGVVLESIWPKRQTDIFEILDVNQASMVFRLSYANFSALFTGDAELGEENPELMSYEWADVDVLKVPHQGSKGAVSSESLQKLKPDLAVIAVGPNKFGHPTNEVIELLKSAGSEVLRTDQDGTVEVVSDDRGKFLIY